MNFAKCEVIYKCELKILKMWVTGDEDTEEWQDTDFTYF